MRTDLQRLKRDSQSGRGLAVSSAGVFMRQKSPGGTQKKLWRILVPAGAFLVGVLIVGSLYYRSHRAKPLTDKDSIVLADFDNKTGDPVFDDTLKTALGVSLSQSPFLNVLSDSTVSKTLKRMQKAADTKLTPD